MKYLIFIFKHRFRRSSLNNILKCKKIKETHIINLSGPFFSLFGKFLYYLIRSKKVVFISCDGLDYLKREKNSINFWMGGTTEKIVDKYKKFQNNFVAASTIFTDESKLLIFYPSLIKKDKFKTNFKFVYVSENKKIENSKSLEIWNKNKENILKNLQLLNDINFWKNIVEIKTDPVQQIYIDIKSLVRNELVNELEKILKEKFILVGTNWKEIYPNALESNYSDKFVENIYQGNVCVDFSKNSQNVFILEVAKLLKVEAYYFSPYIKIVKIYLKIYFQKLVLFQYKT